MTLGLLDQQRLRKAAYDAGFDVLENLPDAVSARSSHGPLRCVLTCREAGFVGELSMANVAHALSPKEVLGQLGNVTAVNADAVAGGDGLAFLCSDLASLDRLLLRAWALSRTLPDALERRFVEALDKVSETERDATVKRRVGQNLFREGLMALWGGRCAMTGLAVPELLRASHAKPWADSNDGERLDVYNGLLLAAHWDAAFDVGLVTVAPRGAVIPSLQLSAEALATLGWRDTMSVKLSEEHEPYFRWHRERVFQS